MKRGEKMVNQTFYLPLDKLNDFVEVLKSYLKFHDKDVIEDLIETDKENPITLEELIQEIMNKNVYIKIP